MAKRRSGGEYEHHIVGVRMRVQGSGNLKTQFTGLDQITSDVLVPLSMSATNSIEPTRLANFQSQRARFELEVTELGEWFRIRRIVIYAKPVAMEYPQ